MGRTKAKALTKDQINKIKQLLLKRRVELSTNLRSGLEEIESHEGHHLADLEDIDDVQDNDAIFEVVNNASATLEQIDRALEKIKKGTYGICEDCGEDISIERLKARPVTSLCIGCKTKRESLEKLTGT